MPSSSVDPVFNYHRNMAVIHGMESSLALGWLNPQDQLIRFEALSGIADLNGKTVLDAGCGYGDLYSHLSKNYHLSHYYGVEQIPEMLEEATKRYPQPNATFIEGNFVTTDIPSADYVFASGSLNYGNNDSGYIFKAINTLFEHARLGLGFNLLRSIQSNGLIVAYDPEIILAHCRALSENVVLNTQYADEDFTIWMYR